MIRGRAMRCMTVRASIVAATFCVVPAGCVDRWNEVPAASPVALYTKEGEVTVAGREKRSPDRTTYALLVSSDKARVFAAVDKGSARSCVGKALPTRTWADHLERDGSLAVDYDTPVEVDVPAQREVNLGLPFTNEGTRGCFNLTIAEDEVLWRSREPSTAIRMAADLTFPARAIESYQGAARLHVGYGRWWGMVRGVVWGAPGIAGCSKSDCAPSESGRTATRFALAAGGDLDVYPLVAQGSALGMGARLETMLAWVGRNPNPGALWLKGVSGVLRWSVHQVPRHRISGQPPVDARRPSVVSVEIEIPIGIWTTDFRERSTALVAGLGASMQGWVLGD